MLDMCILTICKECGKEKDSAEIGNGKPCKHCGGDLISVSKKRVEHYGGIHEFLRTTAKGRH